MALKNITVDLVGPLATGKSTMKHALREILAERGWLCVTDSDAGVKSFCAQPGSWVFAKNPLTAIRLSLSLLRDKENLFSEFHTFGRRALLAKSEFSTRERYDFFLVESFLHQLIFFGAYSKSRLLEFLPYVPGARRVFVFVNCSAEVNMKRFELRESGFKALLTQVHTLNENGILAFFQEAEARFNECFNDLIVLRERRDDIMCVHSVDSTLGPAENAKIIADMLMQLRS